MHGATEDAEKTNHAKPQTNDTIGLADQQLVHHLFADCKQANELQRKRKDTIKQRQMEVRPQHHTKPMALEDMTRTNHC